MKRCLSCDARHAFSEIDCPMCKAHPKMMDGFYAFAPELAHGGGGFKPHYFSELARLEDSNFWFRARNQLILWALKKYCPDFRSLLEVGCGTGYVLSGIAKTFPDSMLYGSEIFTAGLEIAAARLPSVALMQMDARSIPFVDEFDVIGIFDVLEHIQEDERVLAQLHAALKPKGFMLLTVPQHTWLWSQMDEYGCHVRRYEAADLHRKIESAGFRIVRTTSFVSILLPAMVASRLLQKKRMSESAEASTELNLSPWLNNLFYNALAVERGAIRMGMGFPLGGSRLVIAQKSSAKV
ncbi:class I SAM-dependent methyltransferase [Methylacidiphilales bacterium]|nr:class I SAM-dependent methyltransferase [Candidatus Methylacidiphilales bacterium]